jgi:hypothetical protein
MKRLTPFISLVIILVACQSEPAPTPTVSPPPTVRAPSPTPEPTQAPTATATTYVEPTLTFTATQTTSPSPTTPPPPELSYVIWAEMDVGNKKLKVDQYVSIPNNSSTIITYLMLMVPTNLFDNTFHLINLAWEDGTPIEGHDFTGSQLTIPLPEPLSPGEAKNLWVSYELWLPPNNSSAQAGPNPFGYTTRQVNLVDWYPFVPPFHDGRGWLVNDPWAYGEFLVYPIADFDITITMVNVPQPMVIAASAADTGEGDTHKYQLDNGRNFVWSYSPYYEIYETEVNGTKILGYVFSPDKVPGEDAFNATVDAFRLYSDLFGPYPHPQMSMVEADFDHGMEYQSLYFLNKGFFASYDGTSGSFLVAIAAHETSHQWWYGLVANDQALEPWLDEALATYSEYLFYEYYYPQDIDGFWWQRRVNPYNPSGWVNNSIYSAAGYNDYRDAVYLQGAKFLIELRTLMGDEAFFTFLKEYTATYTNQVASGNDFFKVLSTYLNADIDPLLDIYFLR